MALKSLSKPADDLPVVLFKDEKAWSAWLEKNHARSPGVWVRIAKAASGMSSVSYAEAVGAALCYGWIDGQKKTYDETSWLQKFTPRGPKSVWSKINREKAKELIKDGRMKASGLRAIENAKQNGRWDSAYDSPGAATVPKDFQVALNKNSRAKSFFATLDGANRYAILWRLQTARKEETRARRIEQFISMLENKEKIHN